jgi:hypothetical protein
MSLSTCTCGGYIPLGPDASNRCDRCGKGPFDQFPPVDIDALMRQRQDEARGPIYRAALEQIAHLDAHAYPEAVSIAVTALESNQ